MKLQRHHIKRQLSLFLCFSMVIQLLMFNGMPLIVKASEKEIMTTENQTVQSESTEETTEETSEEVSAIESTEEIVETTTEESTEENEEQQTKEERVGVSELSISANGISGSEVNETAGTVTVTNEEAGFRFVCTINNKITPAYFTVTSFTYTGTETSYVFTGLPSQCEWKGQQYPVTHIAADLCKGNKKITRVDLSSTAITVINDNSFQDCANLQEVILPEGILSIGDEAVRTDRVLKTLVLPDTIKSIGCYAFSGCTALEMVGNSIDGETGVLRLPTSLETIGGSAFWSGSDKLQKIFIPKSLKKVDTSLGNGPFYERVFTTIQFEEGIQQIPNSLFENKEEKAQLTEIQIPASVTEIGKKAFFRQTALSQVTFESNSQLLTVGEEAFRTCSALDEMFLPDTVTDIEAYAFSGCDFTYFGGNEAGNMVLPSKLQSLGEKAFWGNDGCTQVTIPATVCDVPCMMADEFGPFYECYNLENIYIESGMESLPYRLFAGICGISINAETGIGLQIHLPETLTTIESYAFYNNDNIAAITIPKTVTEIGASAFEGDSNLKTLTIPKDSALQKISNAAFKNCKKLETFEITPALTRIDDNGFLHCESLQKLWVPKTFLSFGANAFQGCTGLKEIDFEVHNLYTTEQTLGSSAFDGCTSLVKVDLGNRIKTLRSNTFGNCTSLTELSIPYSVTTVESKAFFKCNNLETLFVPKSVTAFNTTETEFERSYQHQPKIYVEKGESDARKKAEKYGWDVEVGIYAVNDEFKDVPFRNRIMTTGIDHNIDTRLTLRELEPVTQLEASGLGIQDMTGVQLFFNLEILDCSDNSISVLDITALKHLTNLNCANNQIKTLDLRNNPLEVLDCSDNCILVIDLTNKTTLTNVVLGNQTGVMATDKNGYEEYILPLKKAYTVDALTGDSIYKKGNVSNITDATTKAVNEGLKWESAYDVPDEIGYQYTTGYSSGSATVTLTATVTITNAGIVLTAEEYPDTALRNRVAEVLDTNQNGLISKNEDQACTSLDASKLGIKDMMGIARLKNLQILNCSENAITNLPISENTELTMLNCNNNRLSELNVFSNTKLTKLECESNQIRNLDISNNKELKELYCDNNRIKTLDTIMNTKLEVLQIGGNAFASLDVSANPAIDTLRTGIQTFDVVKEKKSNGYIVNLKNYDADFIQEKASKVKAYSDGIELSTEESQLQITENGFEVSELVDKIQYEYTVNSEFKNMSVTVNIVEYIEDEETIEDILWDVTIMTIPDKAYTGDEIQPALSVKLDKKKLVLNKDYKVLYRNNVESGVAAVKITGIGDYAEAGSSTIYFNIVESAITKASVSIPDQTYDSTPKTPKPVVTYNTHTLEEGKDYYLSFSNNTKAGKGTVTLTGIGNFKGTLKKTFKINKLNLESLSADDIIVSDSVPFQIIGAKPVVTIQCKDAQLIEKTDYQLSYKNNKKLGTATVTIKGVKSCSGKIVKNFDVTAMPLTDESIQITVASAQKDSKGKAIKPKITVMQGKKKLSEGEKKDYIISYDSEQTKQSGAVTVTIEGRNKYSETVSGEFIIVDKMITKAKASGLKSFVYNGTQLEQNEEDISLKLGKEEIPSDCYEVSYSDNEQAGKATITFTAQPKNCSYEYGGTVSFKYNIAKVKFVPAKNQERVTAELIESIMYYTGEAQKPEIVVRDTELGNELIEGVDYKVTYSNCVNIGTKAVTTITGMGSYQGSIKINYEIKPRDLSEHEDAITIDLKNSAYTGKNISPRLIVRDADTTLRLNKDYTLSFIEISTGEEIQSIKNKGRYQVVIVGKGNYTGELSNTYMKVY